MTQDRKREKEPIQSLADLLAEDILAAPDADILAEMREDGEDPDRVASEMRSLFEKSVLLSNKSRLGAAKAAVAAEKQARSSAQIVDIADARRQLREMLARPDIQKKLTMAARNESELSDADVLGLLQDLNELGMLPPDGAGGGR